MSVPSYPIYIFGSFRLDTGKRRLLHKDEIVPLAPKVFDTLLALVEQSGYTVEKNELMEKIWPDTAVEENNLTQNISTLRKILGAGKDNGRYIVTVPKFGYRFVADVQVAAMDAEEILVKERTKSRIVVENITEQSEDEAFVPRRSWAAYTEAESGTASLWHRRTARQRGLLIVLAAAVMLASLGTMFIWQRLHKAGQADEIAAATLHLSNITRLTSNGNSFYPALSPDGKYVAFVFREAQNRVSIQLMHVETSSTKQVLPSVEVSNLGSLNFSRDGDHIYFVKSEGFGPQQKLYRIPLLGGVATPIVTDLTHCALSTDGAQLAFVRNSPQAGESQLMIASADGSSEYRLATRPLSDPFGALAWSPDDQTIAACVGSTEASGERMYAVAVPLADGKETEITAERWQYTGGIFWLADSSGLIVSGYKSQPVQTGSWHISYPRGEAKRVTDSLATHSLVGQTADSGMLVAQTVELRTSIWVVPVAEEGFGSAALAKQITVGTSDNYPSYLPDGRILFNARDAAWNNDIWVMNADGSERRRLTENASSNLIPVASSDGQYIVFESNRAGKINIWRMDADGGNPKQLTFGANEKVPDVSPDGRWVVYTSADDSTLWRVSIDGGEPQQITTRSCRGNRISPDGKWIATVSKDAQADAQEKMAIIPFAGGDPIKTFSYPKGMRFYPAAIWAPDGQALIFGGEQDGHANVWRQPLTGGKPVPLTDFKSTDQIYRWNWSPDGKAMVFGRGNWTYDILLLRNLR